MLNCQHIMLKCWFSLLFAHYLKPSLLGFEHVNYHLYLAIEYVHHALLVSSPGE